MTDPRKYIDEQFEKFFEFDAPDQSTVASVSCKLFAEHLITDLLAVIQKHRELIEEAIEFGKESPLHDALKISPDNCKLEMVAEYQGMFTTPRGTKEFFGWMLADKPPKPNSKLYTIKTKE